MGELLWVNVVELLCEFAHAEVRAERRHVHGGCGHHVEGHRHGRHHVGGVDTEVNRRGLQLATECRVEAGGHAHSTRRHIRILGEAICVDVHPVGQHRVHRLHCRRKAKAGSLEGSDGGRRRGHGVVLSACRGHRLHAAVLLMLMLMLVMVLVLMLILVLLGRVMLLVLLLLLLMMLLLLRHCGAGRCGQWPSLVLRVGLAVGVEGRVKPSLDTIEGAVEVYVRMVLHTDDGEVFGGRVFECSAALS